MNIHVSSRARVLIFCQRFHLNPVLQTFLKQPLKKKTKIGFQDRLLLSAGQKNCRML